MGTFSISEDPDEMPHNVAFHLTKLTINRKKSKFGTVRLVYSFA